MDVHLDGKVGWRVHPEVEVQTAIFLQSANGRVTGISFDGPADGEAVRTLWEHIDADDKPLPFVELGANGLVQDGRALLFDPHGGRLRGATQGDPGAELAALNAVPAPKRHLVPWLTGSRT